MVISPQQANNNLSRKDKANLRKLEAQIDQNLLQGNTVITLVGMIDAKLKNQLVNRYQHAGWDVACQNDNQGSALYFNQHKEVRGFRPYD
jgi:hypothetical protein